jgi:hypothetical protein
MLPVHRHQLQRGLSDLEPLPRLEHELRQALPIEPCAIGAARIADSNLAILEVNVGVSTRRLGVVQNDVARFAANRRHRSADVPGLRRPIDVLDLENVVATHSFLRGEKRESRNA